MIISNKTINSLLFSILTFIYLIVHSPGRTLQTGRTCLMNACLEGRDQLVEVLLSAGADSDVDFLNEVIR